MFGLGQRNDRIDAFAVAVAGEIAARFPPSREADAAKKKMPDKIVRALEAAAIKASSFRREHKLGIYGKARLLNTFKWEMQRLGYSERFIDAAVSALIRTVTAQR
jgi:hypothetical protein